VPSACSPLGQGAIAHFQPGGLAHLWTDDPDIEPVRPQRGEFRRTGTGRMEAGRRAGGPSQHRRRTDDPDVDEPRSGIFKGLCDRP
jgi:hypothetical protein